MNIHEFQAKELLKQYGAPVSKGVLIEKIEDLKEEVSKLSGSSFVVKAQIHAGGRGKAGGIKLVNNFDQLKKEAQNLIGTTLITHQTGPSGRKIKKLYVEEASEISKGVKISNTESGREGKVNVHEYQGEYTVEDQRIPL